MAILRRVGALAFRSSAFLLRLIWNLRSDRSRFLHCSGHTPFRIRAFDSGRTTMNKRILTTGTLAAVATVIFAIIAFRTAEWSKGLNPEVLDSRPGSSN